MIIERIIRNVSWKQEMKFDVIFYTQFFNIDYPTRLNSAGFNINTLYLYLYINEFEMFMHSVVWLQLATK